MPKRSAGILLFRERLGAIEVLLVHPGGPLWAKKDDGAWTIPKGEIGADEDAFAAARREFAEETGGIAPAQGDALEPIRQKGGKVVHAFACRGEFDVASLRSNTFEMEWPPRSGRMQSFPEVDRAEWHTLDAARRKILPSQAPLLGALERSLRPA